MGGKGKSVKATKGHQKPAKSSNFQTSFNENNAKLMGFDMSGTFEALKIDDSAAKTNYGIDSNLEITFKKMTKKDPTTKLKALKEFIAQIPQMEVTERVVEIYGKLYVPLSMDVDNLVRESSQSALLALIGSGGCGVDSVVMRRIFPSLLISMYDTHPVTSSVAKSCFEKAFSSQDVGAILANFQEEILENFTKNLTLLTPQTICNTQTYSPEECQAKYERVVIASLKGYGMYVEKVNKDKMNECKEKNLELIESDKFFLLHKSKSPQIKAAFFETIANILQHAPTLLIHIKEKLVGVIFKSIDDSEPSISSHVWSCVLLVQIKIELWWTYINMKLFFEKLFMILRSCTNCSLIYPNLLPLVSHFKGVFIGNQLEAFHSNLMKNLHHGLTSDAQTEKLLRSEFSSITGAYFEVLQFIIIQVVNDAEATEMDKIQICSRYMDDYMIATIFWCLNKKGQLPKKLIYQGVAKIAQFFANNSSNNVYGILCERFWAHIFKIIASGMEADQNLSAVASAHLDLIKNLSPPSKKHVRMESDDTGESENVGTKATGSRNLEMLVQKVCQVYINKINITMDEGLVEALECLFKDYQSNQMFEYLKAEFQCELFEIFEKWLKDEDVKHEHVIEIIMVLLQYLDSTGKSMVLQSWNNMARDQKSFFLLKALDSDDECIADFLRSEAASNHFIELAGTLLSDTAGNPEILRKCFQRKNDTFPISHDTCRKIVDASKTNIDNALQDNKMNVFSKNVSFLADIFPAISMSADKKDIEKKIFLLLLESSFNENVKDEEFILKIISKWHEALLNGVLKIDKPLMNLCMKIASDTISLDLSIHRLEFISLCVSMLLSNAFENDENVLSSSFHDLSYLQQLATHIEMLQGKIIKQNSEELVHCEEKDLKKIIDESIKSNILLVNIVLMMIIDDVTVLKKQKEDNKKTNFDEDDDDESETGVEEEISSKVLTKLYDEIDFGTSNHWPQLMNIFPDVLKIFSVFDTFLSGLKLEQKQKEWINYTREKLRLIFVHMPADILKEVQEIAKPEFTLCNEKYSGAIKKLIDDSVEHSLELDLNQLKIYEAFGDLNEKKIIPMELLDKKCPEIAVNVALMRLMIANYLDVTCFNEANDVKIINFSLNVLDEIITKNKASSFLLYKRDLNLERFEDVLFVTSVMHMMSEILTTFPSKLNENHWDFIRLALSNWTLSLKKSCEQKYDDAKIQVFVVAIFKLNAALLNFITQEKVKSSSQLIASVIDEWQAIFSTDVNTILLQIFIEIVKQTDQNSEYQKSFMNVLCHQMDIDFSGVLRLRSSLISLNECLEFSIASLRNINASVRTVAAKFIRNLVPEILKSDQELLVQNNSKYSDDDVVASDWHKLEMFKAILVECQEIIKQHVDISSLRFSEASDVTTIPSDVALSYLLTWDCILSICASSSLELRSVYINWISINHLHDTFLSSIFEMIPRILIKNSDISLQLGFALFSPVEPNYEDVSVERLAAFLYSKSLRVMPVLVRKWWHGTNSKIAHVIDKITVNYISPILCTEELSALISKKEKDSNMNIRVLMNSREVIATYNIDTAKMELQLKLANNHPLGVIKVESKKHLGGKLQGFEIVKQLSIYLSHQNGRLCDGISIWKRNLDKKYEGVEECFICYSVVQLDNLQLPKITCKACKKKFHSACLYRWFSSSNKSTCPLCRNDF